jgi:hypothetical protein
MKLGNKSSEYFQHTAKLHRISSPTSQRLQSSAPTHVKLTEPLHRSVLRSTRSQLSARPRTSVHVPSSNRCLKSKSIEQYKHEPYPRPQTEISTHGRTDQSASRLPVPYRGNRRIGTQIAYYAAKSNIRSTIELTPTKPGPIVLEQVQSNETESGGGGAYAEDAGKPAGRRGRSTGRR